MQKSQIVVDCKKIIGAEYICDLLGGHAHQVKKDILVARPPEKIMVKAWRLRILRDGNMICENGCRPLLIARG